MNVDFIKENNIHFSGDGHSLPIVLDLLRGYTGNVYTNERHCDEIRAKLERVNVIPIETFKELDKKEKAVFLVAVDSHSDMCNAHNKYKGSCKVLTYSRNFRREENAHKVTCPELERTFVCREGRIVGSITYKKE